MEICRHLSVVVAGSAAVPQYFDFAVGRHDSPKLLALRLVGAGHASCHPPSGGRYAGLDFGICHLPDVSIIGVQTRAPQQGPFDT